ncbi:NEW3 domain-containing protein [Thermococcus paralvinellae]|uniref:Alpha-galactosidase NEW3 domain-containing protein n=1 Tax=Thermococcus paralvinellae TaxID=582419 RepID=W0I2R8_9EURY|nr:NEW3 domain-containing protein [Thermococcus paralvinellae]AHF80319.1 Hypothetical protein TES1_0933 [Thermococcus paralvinellae]
MKKLALLIAGLLVVSFFPISNAQPWVEIFEGRVKIGESLKVGDYLIKLTQNKDYQPYIIVYKGEDIKALQMATFGTVIEVESLKIVVGSLEDDKLFLVIQWKPELVEEISPKPGEEYKIGDYIVYIENVTDKQTSLKINAKDYLIPMNSSIIYDKLVLEYKEGKLYAYLVKVSVEKVPKLDYEVHYPFDSITAKAGETVEIPIEIINTGDTPITLPLRVVFKPVGWEVKIKVSDYEVNELTLKPNGQTGSSVTAKLEIKIPSMEKGLKIIRFSIGKELGEIKIYVQQKEEIEVKLPILSIESEAGEKVAFPITLTNYGPDKIINLQVVEKPKDWDAYFMLNGVRVRSFLLPGATSQGATSEIISLVAEIPRNAELGNHKIKFAINNATYSFSIFIYKTHEGEPARLIVTVKDEEGNPVRKARIHVGNSTVFTDNYGKAEIELKAGNYKVFVEKEGYEKVREEITLEDGEEKNIEITLKRLPYYFTVEGEGDTITVTTGSIGTYTLTIENLGKEDDAYTLSVLGLPSEWSSEFYYVQSPVRSIKVEAGSSKDVMLRIVPPFNAQPGEYNLTIVVKSSSGFERKLALLVKLIGEYRFEMYPEMPMISIKAGKEGIAYVSLENTGTAPITNIKFEVSAPQGWEVKVVPQVIPELKSHYIEKENIRVVGIGSEQNRITITVKVPETTPAGTYQITITGKGDQAQASTQITVRVTQSSKSAYIGILMLVLTFGAVIWMMRRVGRR